MELIVSHGGFKIECAGCMGKEKIGDIKRIGSKYYCKTCQDLIYSSLTNKKATENEEKETTEN